MQNFYAPPEDFTTVTVTLTGSEHHHATRSCRLRLNEIISVTDGLGRRVIGKVTEIGRESLICKIEQDVSGEGEPAIQITLALPLIQPSRCEIALEKCTETGVRRFIPLLTERAEPGISGRFKKERFERIVFEAAKQSRRSWIPEILPPKRVEELLKEPGIRFFAASIEGETDIRSKISGIGENTQIAIIIGPEGNFTEHEFELMKSFKTEFFRMGGLTLRTETAAIVAAALFVDRIND